MSLEYPKIETLYKRGDDHLVTGVIRCREFAQIKHWLVTEKIDGTNIRVSLEPHGRERLFYDDPEPHVWTVRFHGRTDKAQIPAFLLQHLQDTFTLEKMELLWRGKQNCDLCGGAFYRTRSDGEHGICGCVVPYPITLYGEGYGARIQKGGGNYRPDSVSFRLFDVLVDDKYWLEWKNVSDIASKLGIKTVPQILHVGEERLDLVATTNMVWGGFESQVAWEENGLSDYPAEGIVARTDPYLYDSRGRPVRFKLKTKDYGAERPEREARNV